MIDPQIAFDKLAQFTTANEVAEYLGYAGAQGVRGDWNNCPIANFMKNQTGRDMCATENRVWDYYDVNVRFASTDAMEDFVVRFDEGEFSSLEIRK